MKYFLVKRENFPPEKLKFFIVKENVGQFQDQQCRILFKFFKFSV